jgi:hypothetical protein
MSLLCQIPLFLLITSASFAELLGARLKRGFRFAPSGLRIIPTKHRHDLVGGRTRAGNAAKLLKSARGSRPVSSFDNDAAVGGSPEGNLGTGFYS